MKRVSSRDPIEFDTSLKRFMHRNNIKNKTAAKRMLAPYVETLQFNYKRKPKRKFTYEIIFNPKL